MMVDGMEGGTTPIEASEPSAPSTFDSIASGVTEGFENPAADETDTGDAPIGDGGEGTPDPDGAAEPAPGDEGAPAAGDDEAEADEVLNALANLNRDDVPEELKPMYDQLIEARRNMQADYTRKTQKVADESKSIAQVYEELEALRAQVNQPIQAPLPQETPGDYPDLREVAWSGLGKPMDIMEALETQDNGVALGNYMVATARQVVMEAMQQAVLPRLEDVSSKVESRRVDEADRAISAWESSNPDIADHIDKAVALIEAGLASDLGDAAEKVRLMVKGPEQIQQAAAVAMRAGEEKARNIAKAQEQFSVPAGSTTPRPSATPTGTSFDEIAAGVVSQITG